MPSKIAEKPEVTGETPAKAKRVRTVVPEIDWSNLPISDASDDDFASIHRGRSSIADGTPFPAWLEESMRTGKGKRIPVPESAVDGTMAILRAAARSLGQGVPQMASEPNGKGVSLLSFRAREVRPTKSREKKSVPSDE